VDRVETNIDCEKAQFNGEAGQCLQEPLDREKRRDIEDEVEICIMARSAEGGWTRVRPAAIVPAQ
jgi:hypothetical protein